MAEPTRGAEPRALVQFRVGAALSPELARRVKPSRSASRAAKRSLYLHYELLGLVAPRLDFSEYEIKLIRQVVSRDGDETSPQLLPALLEVAARTRPAPTATPQPLFRAAPGDQLVRLGAHPLARLAERVRSLDPAALYALIDHIEQSEP